MKAIVCFFITIFFVNCSDIPTNKPSIDDSGSSKPVAPKKVSSDSQKSVKIRLDTSSQPRLKNDRDWIIADSAMVSMFVKAILKDNRLDCQTFNQFFGEQSEFEIELLMEEYGKIALERSKEIVTKPSEFQSLALTRIIDFIREKVGKFESIRQIKLEKTIIDINYFVTVIVGTHSEVELAFLTNSSKGSSHLIVDITEKKKSIINGQTYN